MKQKFILYVLMMWKLMAPGLQKACRAAICWTFLWKLSKQNAIKSVWLIIGGSILFPENFGTFLSWKQNKDWRKRSTVNLIAIVHSKSNPIFLISHFKWSPLSILDCFPDSEVKKATWIKWNLNFCAKEKVQVDTQNLRLDEFVEFYHPGWLIECKMSAYVSSLCI